MRMKPPLSYRDWHAKHFLDPIENAPILSPENYEFRFRMYNAYLDKWLKSVMSEEVDIETLRDYQSHRILNLPLGENG